MNKGIQFFPFINMGLGLFISSFDFYQAYFNFEKISDTVDPKIRQDLMVNGSLSLLSGGLGVGTSLTAIVGYKSALLGGVAYSGHLAIIFCLSSVRRHKKPC
ncbi:hypothetical protein BJP41_06060 [Candidatus Williamhamiltonella defendens]|uniref:Uncharacterized protein n=1 Tax=Candidatus Williamhamiltonella defendens TaxID=138072 RepID=A0A2D3T2C5_9ENTR|nr:hypothetical protein [Candidatus Hamiltonella defensa]ASV33232.1 hypothetical protein CJJ18_03095 [Candidatus Hamiltonella defensa]ATW22558.1 hypothetical protein BJP44_05610 [Candidatus Hamiltonella defensa]ATW29962.1 hypothetical protein BJP41_06060 [Candidatus Hamiltonella defensa]ATW31936.1 hypothetical protein BJP42_06155 [Candidatus Hamiltonella defensa]AWK16192.1 hypothetical protein CCS40_03120 [Candidatus Hamiltonella defensa]